MPILCLEGPSAVGKSTTAKALADAEGAHIIPEVHVLWERRPRASSDWYLKRQVDRWRMASEAVERHGLVILDGDPFQPLWYNWSYNFAGWQPLEVLDAFYRQRLWRRELAFPDLYVILNSRIERLREQKDADVARQRRQFDEHVRFIAPQRRYFEAMQRLAAKRVLFVEAEELHERVRVIAAGAVGVRQQDGSIDLFDSLVSWLAVHQAF